MASRALKVQAIIPALNVAQVVVPRVIERIPANQVDEVVVVDDGSTDDTADVARRAGATVIRHEQNRGVGAALRSGLSYAKDRGHDAVVILNAQGKYDPSDIATLLTPLREGRADLVQGSRFVPGGRHVGMPLRRLLGQHAYSAVFSALLGHRITDASSGIRAFLLTVANHPQIDLSQPWLDRYELEPYLLYRAVQVGLRVVEVPMLAVYPKERASYTRMRPGIDWWHLSHPLVVLGAERARDLLSKLRPGR